eukprot:TRINITY_DN1292_c2_g1_i1.p1 TRINITY_DN1292_c2_g1~~TRINITY_DN1292_c2_g1_i1.p1  ORF type:complete len:134 (-),score=47.20 TRINITY_DN1292_c2_g1_i1:131-493(-)
MAPPMGGMGGMGGMGMPGMGGPMMGGMMGGGMPGMMPMMGLLQLNSTGTQDSADALPAGILEADAPPARRNLRGTSLLQEASGYATTDNQAQFNQAQVSQAEFNQASLQEGSACSCAASR